MKKIHILIVFALLIGFSACKNRYSDGMSRRDRKKAIADSTSADSLARIEWEYGDGEYYEGEEISGSESYPYQATRTREFDLIHTKLDVRFNWEKAQMPGKAWLKLKPYFYPSSLLTLDAKGFDIAKVALNKGGMLTELRYEYDSLKLKIHLDKEYKNTEELEVYIEYTAKPEERKTGGSAAITSDKGLYFINYKNEEPNKPQQIWTQGETESNSGWFPTIDSPNEKCTEEIYITVDSKFKTLSNGIMVSSTNNPDGTRTDYWKMDLPHAPYLFMMAIGDYAIVKDVCCGGMEVSYYVEKEYEPYARLIFGHTPEMIEHFGNVLGVKYPWPKFSQVVVRDFVSGAMENTSAVVHFDRLQHNANEHLDATYESIISHELFHHWFGDLVTAESWSNISLNESFATYGQYIWDEHKYGRDEADHGLEEFEQQYLGEASYKQEQLIRFKYNSREDVFDAHSYQKGGFILHMLRKTVGDEAFYKSLNLYLTQNAYKSAEAHQLRLAFEEVTGQDMNWFWNQWYYKSGHIAMEVYDNYDAGANQVQLDVKYTDEDHRYELYTSVEVCKGELKKIIPLHLKGNDTIITIDLALLGLSGQPDYIDFDSENSILGSLDEIKSQDEWIAQLRMAGTFRQESEAIEQLRYHLDNDAVKAAFVERLSDLYWAIRQRVLNAFIGSEGEIAPDLEDKITMMAKKDPRAGVRADAYTIISYLTSNLDYYGPGEEAEVAKKKQKYSDLFIEGMKDSSYAVQEIALNNLYMLDHALGVAEAKKLSAAGSTSIKKAIAEIMMQEKDPQAMDYVNEYMKSNDDQFSKYLLIDGLGEYLTGADEVNQQKGFELLKNIAGGKDIRWIRSAAIYNLGKFLDKGDNRAFLERLKDSEKDEELKTTIEETLAGGN